MNNLTISTKVVENISSRYDDRKGLGYGVLKGKFHVPRSLNTSYPYTDEDVYASDEEFEDEETSSSIRAKTLDFFKTDPLSHKSTDAFYFSGGNIKLSDCFNRPDYVLNEVNVFGDSMSPVPGDYKTTSFGKGSGASFPSGVGNLKRTGSKRGYFSSPPRVKDDDETRPEDEPIENLEDLFIKQSRERGEFSLKKA